MPIARSASNRSEPLVIAATFSAQPLAQVIAFWRRTLDVSVVAEFAPFNQLLQELLDPHSLLGRNDSGAGVLLVRFEDLSDTPDQLPRVGEELCQALRTFSSRQQAPVIVVVCPPSPRVFQDPDLVQLHMRLQTRLAEVAQRLPDAYLMTPDTINAMYPVEEHYDGTADELGRIPYTQDYFTALGTVIVRTYCGLRRSPYKVVVLDADDTLWQGRCGEEGPNAVQLTAPHVALQEFMRRQHDAGRLLCLCSKNAEADVVAAFRRHPDMPLQWDHITARRINWQPKSANLRALAQELKLGLDSFILIDDDPLECAEVRANCPEILSLCLPRDSAQIPQFLNHVWALDVLHVTDEDRRRPQVYRTNREREQLRQEHQDLGDFIRSLELKIEIAPLTPAYCPRASELTLRTNQFNFTTRRYQAAELSSLIAARALEGVIVDVTDRFGAYGTVGLALFKQAEQSLWVDTFLLSCRCLGRGVEHRMLRHLGAVASARGIELIRMRYISSARNEPVQAFIAAIGAIRVHPDAPGSMCELPVHEARALQHPALTPRRAPIDEAVYMNVNQ